LREAKLFDTKLGGIDGAGNVGVYLFGLVVAKAVAQPVAPAPASAPASTQPKLDDEAAKSNERIETAKDDTEKPATATS
jgi:vacuolar protein sorting-associated protein 54